MTQGAHGIGYITPVRHPNRQCRWCRRMFTPSPLNQAPTQQYDKPKCGTMWRSRKRTLERLATEHATILSRPIEMDQPCPDGVDEAARVGRRAVEINNDWRRCDELALIQDALQRLQAGTYSLCVECEDPIPDNHLSAIPWAPRCIQCEERAA